MSESKSRKIGTGASARVATRKRSKPQKERPETAPPLILMGRTVARILLLCMAGLTPWYYGSVSWSAQLVCCIASILLLCLAACFGIHCRQGRTVHRCLLVLLLLSGLQTVPLPDFLWHVISPNAGIAKRLDSLSEEFLVDAAAEIGPTNAELVVEEPSTISVSPLQTRASLGILATALAVLWSATLLLTNRQWRIAALIVIAASSGANATLGLVQSVGFTERTLLPGIGASSFATFVNRNSAPQLYVLGAGCLLSLIAWWLNAKGSSLAKKYNVHYPAVNLMARLRRRLESAVSELDAVLIVLLLGIVATCTAILATASRGGILACGLALLVVTLRLLSDSRAKYIGLLVLAGSVFSVLLLSLFGLDSATSTRLGSLSQEFHRLSNVRLELWKSVLEHSDYWLVGSGYGTFHFAVLACEFPFNQAWFYHAESLYVEAFVTMGILGFLVAMFAIGTTICEVMFGAEQRNFATIALLPGVCAIAAQSVVDFSLILPGIFLPLVTLLGGFCNEAGFLRSKLLAPVGKIEGFISIAIVLVMMGLSLPAIVDFSKAERLARGNGDSLTSNLDFEIARREQQAFKQFVLQSTAWPPTTPDEVKQYFSRPGIFVAAQTFRARELPHLAELANDQPHSLEYLAQTAQPMAAAASLSPLDWRASWGLLRADVGVLTTTERARNFARIYSFSRHRPEVLSEVGNYLLWTEQRELGLRFWKRAVAISPKLGTRASSLVPEFISARELLDLLPVKRLDQIEVLLELDSRIGFGESETIFSEIPIEEAMSEARTSENWLLVSRLAAKTNQPQKLAECLTRAADKAPSRSELRYQAAQAWKAAGDFDQAIREVSKAILKNRENKTYRDLQKELERLSK